VQRTLRSGTAILLTALAACHRTPKAAEQSPDSRLLDAFAAQRIVVAPTGYVRGGDSLGWVQAMGGNKPAGRSLDSAIARALEDRGLSQRWVMPPALVRAFERNRSYATDPYLLAMEPLRSSVFISGKKYGEPLSSQLRAMTALETDVRYVLLPVELKFEPYGGGVRGVLKMALLDTRAAEARYVGHVNGAPARAAGPALGNVGLAVADLFLAR
jgi:hypothetical protein